MNSIVRPFPFLLLPGLWAARNRAQRRERGDGARAIVFGVRPNVFEKRDIHVHVPEGATPKDGPSAGIAICTSIISALTGIPVRRDVAMTGEVTLRGRVLPIGGVKEKVLGAHRAGITDVILPKANLPDLEDVPEEARKVLRFHFVEHLDEVLAVALADRHEEAPALSVH